MCGSIDVYTPQNLDPTKIVRAIQKKSNQAGGVFVQADLPSTDMSSIAARMWGKANAQSIKTIFFQKPDYSKKSKGSFGRSKSEQRESYDSTNVASVVEAGQDLTVNASQAASGSVTLDGGRNVTVSDRQRPAEAFNAWSSF
ncbi:hypothetical protein J3P95_04200 [Pseudomonas sp. Z5-35]